MKSRLSQIFTMIGALVAFAPVLAVDFLLDSYVRTLETQRTIVSVEAITHKIQLAVYDSISSLQKILNDSPSLCTNTFITNTRKQVQSNLYLTQVLVENSDGVQYCDAYESDVVYSVRSSVVTIPGQTETIGIVELEGQNAPSLKISQSVGSNRTISAFVHIELRPGGGLPSALSEATLLRVALTNGDEIVTIGDSNVIDKPDTTPLIVVTSIADVLPLITEVAIPFELVRARYADLDIGLTVLVALMGVMCLVFAFKYIQQARLPAIDLERAIASGEFKPYYQPVMNLSTGQVSGCEVLIRWVKKSGEVISPGMFIDYAETTGLAIPMTIKMMQQVRADLEEFCTEFPDLKIGINLFEGHFRNGAIIEDVEAIFGGSSINFRQLVFEITERRPLEDQASAISVIGGLRAMGCRIAMDDAGTGHSNLAYMQTLGIDIIKIDRVFVEMIGPETKNLPILDGLIAMAADLGTDVIAEGVETEAQAVYLREHTVFEAQGFLFAPALKPEPFMDFVRALDDVSNQRAETSQSEVEAA